MLKVENGRVELGGDVKEVMMDFAAAASILVHVVQRDFRMSPEQAKAVLKDAVNVGTMSSEELRAHCTELKTALRDAKKQEGGACDGCGGKGACRCGTDEADG